MSRPFVLKILRWIGITVGSLFLLLAAAIAFIIWQRPWTPFLDDGPFKGRTVTSLPATEPLQVFPIKEFILEIYSPAAKDEAPIVLLRGRDNKVKWAVHAEAMKGTHVASLKFIDYRTVFETTVRGTVHWTFGQEATWWMIDRDGTLKEYWYSW